MVLLDPVTRNVLLGGPALEMDEMYMAAQLVDEVRQEITKFEEQAKKEKAALMEKIMDEEFPGVEVRIVTEMTSQEEFLRKRSELQKKLSQLELGSPARTALLDNIGKVYHYYPIK